MARTRQPSDVAPRRLRMLLGLVFLLLSLPTAALLWQALSQLKWEAWYQHRAQAEELTNRIDRQVSAAVGAADARGFDDFAFVKSDSGANANLVERSPLAAWPVRGDLPGTIGYFQVGASGEFSTPLLPSTDSAAGQLGIDPGELTARKMLAGQILSVLADNRLVRDRLAPGRVMTSADAPLEAETDAVVLTGSMTRIANPSRADAAATTEEKSPDMAEEVGAAAPQSAYSQQAFDELNAPRRQAPASAAEPAFGKLEDLRLDEQLQKRSETRQRNETKSPDDALDDKDVGEASKAAREMLPPAPAAASPRVGASTFRGRVDTFGGEIDPFEFSLLDSGHLVLFRNVWRDGQRYVQGILIDRDRFLANTVEIAFRGEPLAAMSDLVVGYRDNIIGVFRGNRQREYSDSAGALDGTLLYRGRLSAPLAAIELVYSINRLPAGPGARVLAWTAVVLALVFVSGFYALYRLGLGQIRLARQQQDFVSAVSHELKTPLTSIRMYGEMLKEGWADEAKKKQYYEFIHDESERLTRLISNVLQLARITRNEPRFETRQVSVCELLDSIRSKIASQIERAGFQLRVHAEPDATDAIIEIDADCFAQIVINLVDNAIKFSKHTEQPRIDIAAASTGRDSVTFSVRDYGPGIPRNQLKKIFRLFYRPESELTRETVGTGIGLAIVHQLTLAMGGSVDVVNREPGAEFRVTFRRCG